MMRLTRHKSPSGPFPPSHPGDGDDRQLTYEVIISLLSRKPEQHAAYGNTARGASSPIKLDQENITLNYAESYLPATVHKQGQFSDVNKRLMKEHIQPALHMPEPLSMTCIHAPLHQRHVPSIKPKYVRALRLLPPF